MADQGKSVKNGKKSISRRQFQYKEISNTTFIPYFSLDSKYLKSLLIGKGYMYMSLKTCFGTYIEHLFTINKLTPLWFSEA